jgi:hypothetical protein
LPGAGQGPALLVLRLGNWCRAALGAVFLGDGYYHDAFVPLAGSRMRPNRRCDFCPAGAGWAVVRGGAVTGAPLPVTRLSLSPSESAAEPPRLPRRHTGGTLAVAAAPLCTRQRLDRLGASPSSYTTHVRQARGGAQQLKTARLRGSPPDHTQ